MKEFIKKLKLTPIKIVGAVISALAVFLCLFILIEVIVANNENRPPSIFGVSVSYVPTGSMEPTISQGDYVMFKKTGFENIQKDDIIVYRSSEGRFIIHRVIEKYSDFLIVKGDANIAADSENVTADMLLGKYTCTISFLDFLSGGVSRNSLFILLIVLFVLIIGVQIVSFFLKAKKEEIEKKSEDDKKLMLEQMRNEIMQEELAKLKEQNKANASENEKEKTE